MLSTNSDFPPLTAGKVNTTDNPTYFLTYHAVPVGATKGHAIIHTLTHGKN